MSLYWIEDNVGEIVWIFDFPILLLIRLFFPNYYEFLLNFGFLYNTWFFLGIYSIFVYNWGEFITFVEDFLLLSGN